MTDNKTLSAQLNKNVPEELREQFQQMVTDLANACNSAVEVQQQAPIPDQSAALDDTISENQGRFAAAANKKDVGKMLKKARNHKKMTQEQVGNKIGLKGATMRGFESGRNNQSIANIQKFANAIGYNASVVLTPKSDEDISPP